MYLRERQTVEAASWVEARPQDSTLASEEKQAVGRASAGVAPARERWTGAGDCGDDGAGDDGDGGGPRAGDEMGEEYAGVEEENSSAQSYDVLQGEENGGTE